MSSEPVELELQLLGETPAAYLVRDGDEDGDREVWLPKSQVWVLSGGQIDKVMRVEVPEWLAIDKGLV
jgi:hypothetical protein